MAQIPSEIRPPTGDLLAKSMCGNQPGRSGMAGGEFNRIGTAQGMLPVNHYSDYSARHQGLSASGSAPVHMKSAHQPADACHPGATLTETLNELGMTIAGLAGRTGRSAPWLDSPVRGESAVTLAAATALEIAINIPTRCWRRHQANLDRHPARVARQPGLHGNHRHHHHPMRNQPADLPTLPQ